jgi:hypothetical protein
MEQLLAAMAAVGDGDFSVQLPRHWEGVDGKLAESFQSDRQSQSPPGARPRAGRRKVGRQGLTRHRLVPANRQGCLGRDGTVDQRPDRRLSCARSRR